MRTGLVFPEVPTTRNETKQKKILWASHIFLFLGGVSVTFHLFLFWTTISGVNVRRKEGEKAVLSLSFFLKNSLLKARAPPQGATQRNGACRSRSRGNGWDS